jgi:hypothetical protein
MNPKKQKRVKLSHTPASPSQIGFKTRHRRLVKRLVRHGHTERDATNYNLATNLCAEIDRYGGVFFNLIDFSCRLESGRLRSSQVEAAEQDMLAWAETVAG